MVPIVGVKLNYTGISFMNEVMPVVFVGAQSSKDGCDLPFVGRRRVSLRSVAGSAAGSGRDPSVDRPGLRRLLGAPSCRCFIRDNTQTHTVLTLRQPIRAVSCPRSVLTLCRCSSQLSPDQDGSLHGNRLQQDVELDKHR